MECLVSIYESDFKMSSEQGEKVLETLRSWCKEENPELERVDLSFVMKTNSIVDVFDELGYSLNIITDDLGQVQYELRDMIHEKLGNDLEIFNKIAPCLDDDLYIHYHDEYDEHFRYYFKNGKCTEQIAKIIFEE